MTPVAEAEMDVTAAYASGALSAPFRLLVDARMAMVSSVREDVAFAEVAGGALLESITPAAMAADALKDTLDLLDDAKPQTLLRTAAVEAGKGVDELLGLPEPVRSAAFDVVEKTGGWRFAGPGVRVMELIRNDEAKAELIRLEPGAGTPHHGHSGAEATLVMCGAFRDDEQIYRPGELCIAGPDVTHRPIAEEGEVCIALAVTDAPLKFKGALGVVQRMFGLH